MSTTTQSIDSTRSGGVIMEATAQLTTVSIVSYRAGLVISILAALFLLLDAVMKFVQPEVVVTTTTQLGYPASTILPIGATLLLSTLLYLFPKTSVLGAILLTGYLGGAVATHVRVGGGAFPIVFAVAFGVLVWLGLYLRDARLQALVPILK
jgi:hypothetical protein